MINKLFLYIPFLLLFISCGASMQEQENLQMQQDSIFVQMMSDSTASAIQIQSALIDSASLPQNNEIIQESIKEYKRIEQVYEIKDSINSIDSKLDKISQSL